MLIDDIRQYSHEAATAGDFNAVATVLRSVSVTATARACFGLETAEALDAVGPRRRAIMSAMSTDPDGQFVLNKLAGTGVVWAHPRTVALMGGLIAAKVMEPEDKAALVQLSAPTTIPHAEVTADSCRDAWMAVEKQTALNLVTDTAAEAAREEYRKAESTPATIIAAAVAVLEGL